MELAKLFVSLALNAKEYTKAINKVAKETAKFGKNIIKTLGGAIKTAVKVGVVALASLGVAVLGLGAKLVNMGSDAAEMQSKFDAVFKDSAPEATAALDELADRIGRNRFELMGFAANLQDTFVPLGFARDAAAGMSVQMVELAEDLASFNNLPTQSVVEDLQSAFVGNSEVLLKYGVVANQAAIEQFALTNGLIATKKELGPQEKALAILGITLAATTDAQGDATTTALGFANQMRALKSSISETATVIGVSMLPALEPMIQEINAIANDSLPDLVTAFDTNLLPVITDVSDAFRVYFVLLRSGFEPSEALSRSLGQIFEGFEDIETAALEVVDKLTAVWDAVVLGLQPLTDVIGQFVTMEDAMNALATVAGSVLLSSLASIAITMGTIAAPMLVMIALSSALRAAWNKDWKGIKTTITAVWGAKIKPIFAALEKWLDKNIPVAVEVAIAIFDKLSAMFTSFVETITPILDILGVIPDIILTAWANIAPLFSELLTSLSLAFGRVGIIVGDLMPILIGLGIILAGIVVAAITVAAAAITGFVRALVFVIDAVSFFAALLIQGLLMVVEGVATIIGGAIAFIRAIIENDAGAALAALGDIVVGIFNIILGIVQAVLALFIGTIGVIIAAIAVFITTVIDFFIDLWTALVGASIIPDMVEAIIEWFTTLVTDVIALVSTWVTDMIAGATQFALDFIAKFIEIKDSIIEKVAEMIDAVTFAFATFATGLVTKATTLATDIKNAFTGIDWLSLGGDIVSGIADGISAGASAIATAATEAAQGALDAAKDLLGISSPSRVAAQLVGAPFSEGVALGIVDTLAPIDAAVNALTGALVNPLVGDTRGGDTFNTSIVSNQPADQIVRASRTMDLLMSIPG